IDALLQTVNKKGFEILTKTVVQNIQQNEHGYEVSTTNGSFSADYIIYAPGSAPKSLKMIQQLGHKLVPAVPSLFTFNIKNEVLHDLMGPSLPNAVITIPSLRTDQSGPLLMTPWRLCGLAGLKISARKARGLAECGYKAEIVVNFLGMDTEDAA